MKKWSIKAKLVLLCSALLGIMLVVGGVGVASNHVFQGQLDYIQDVQLPSVHAMGLTDMYHDGLRAIVLQAIVVSDSGNQSEKIAVADEFKEMTANMNKQLGVLNALNLTAEAKKTVTASEAELQAYIKQAEEVIALALSGRKLQAMAKMPEFLKSFEDLEEKLEKIGSGLANEADTIKAANEQKETFLRIANQSITFFGFLFGLFMSFYLVRDLMKTLVRTIDELTASNHELAAAATQTTTLATELSESTTEQASSIQETMASIAEISAMVSQNAGSAVKVKEAVEANQFATEEGTRSIGEMLNAMGEIRSTNDGITEQMVESNRKFSEIVNIITEIGKKTNVINDIVFQTKLLSFNASVEAARAGEYGKGFTIVAAEVGNLAQMSGNAAKEISDLLSTSIVQVNEIVEQTTRRVDQLVKVGKEKIDLGEETAQKCNEALDKITRNAGSVSSMISEITHASQEQAQGIQEINKAISEMDMSIQKNSSVAQTSSVQADHMNSEAQGLGKTIEGLANFVRGEGAFAASPARPVKFQAPKQGPKDRFQQPTRSKKSA